MTRAEAAGWALAAGVALASPPTGSVAFGLVALAPLAPPRPRTTASPGPALVTAVMLASGWLGLAVFQVTRRFDTPWLEHLSVLCALVGLTTSAARLGGEGDPAEARERAVLRLVRAGLAAFTAALLVVVVRHGHPGFRTAKELLAIDAPARGIGGTLAFVLFLERRRTVAALRRSPGHLALVAGCLVVAWAVRVLHGR